MNDQNRQGQLIQLIPDAYVPGHSMGNRTTDLLIHFVGEITYVNTTVTTNEIISQLNVTIPESAYKNLTMLNDTIISCREDAQSLLFNSTYKQHIQTI